MVRKGRGRGLTRDDARVWRRVTDSVTPLGKEHTKTPNLLPDKPEPAEIKQRKPQSEPEPPPSAPSYQEKQLDGRTADRLRRGRLEPERSIDLHGMTAQMAETMLTRFIANAVRDQVKVVLVITGKGRQTPVDDDVIPRRRGVIRESLPMWIGKPALSPHVIKAVPAHPKHGGSGAFYLYLKRARRRT